MSVPTILDFLHSVISKQQIVQGVDLSRLDLRQVDLTGLAAQKLLALGTRFDYALLTETQLIEADFTEASPDGSHLASSNLGLACFNRASMRQVCLQYASFINGYCKDANLEYADLTGAELTGSLFFGSHLHKAVLYMVKADNTGFNRADMKQADLRDGSFIRATFNHADLTEANLSGGNFSQADFRQAKLDNVNWENVNLAGALFSEGTSTK